MSPQPPNDKMTHQDQRSFLRSTTTLSYHTALSFSEEDIDGETITPMQPSNPECTGELVAIVAPKEFKDFNMNKDETNRIDPSAFENALDAIAINQNHEPESDDGFQFDTIVDIKKMDPDDLIVSLDLDLHVKEDIHLHMNREASEAANRTFSRLEISAAKRISSVLSPRTPGTGKSGKRNKKGIGKDLIPASRLFTRDGSVETTLNPEEYNAMDLCETLALKHNSEDFQTDSIALELSVPNIAAVSAKGGSIDLEFTVTSNPPTILGVQTFEAFSSKLFTGVPVVIQTTLLHATRAQVSWFVGHELVETSHKFTPRSEHIGKNLSVVITPIREGYHGKCFKEAYQFESVIEELPFMPIVSPLRDEFTMVKRTAEERKSTMRMMTYNILADLYVSRELEDNTPMFPHVEYEFMRKTRRMPMIVAEILAYDADIICLQEVDGLIYDTYFEPVMQAMGYDAFYSNKASCQREGCAMFWNRKVFERDEALTFSLRELFDDTDSHPSPKPELHRWDSMTGIKHLLKSHPELRRVTMEKIGQILQVVKLKIKNPQEGQPHKVVIANTHLFYHPMADHIRAMQAYVVCRKIDEVRRRDISQHPYPLMLCGDLNSDPLSGASQLLFTRSVEPDHPDCWKYLHEYQWDMGNNEYMLEHEYIGNEAGATDLKYEEEKFKNAVENVKKVNKPTGPPLFLPDEFPQLISGCEIMPEFTNFAVDFVDTLDYILASEQKTGEAYGFIPTKSARMPTSDDVKQFVAMPNKHMPSDHVSVVADFEWCKKN